MENGVIQPHSSPQVSVSKWFVPDINEGVGFEDSLDKCISLCVTSKIEEMNLLQYVASCRRVISWGRVTLFVKKKQK